MIVLDTDVLIEIFDKHSVHGEKLLKHVVERGDSVATTSINLHEVLYGLEKYARPNTEILQLPILNYMKEDARLSVRLELSAEKSGKTIRRADAMIGAICVRNEADFFTLDLKHFVPMKSFGLRMFP